MPAGSLSPFYVEIELERLHLAARIVAVNRQTRREQQARFYRYVITFWPVALGVLLSAYAPLLHDLAASYGTWAATILFPFSAVAEQHGLNISWATAQTLSQVMLYAQFALDGLMARMVLKHRTTLKGVCGQVAGFHALAVLYIALVSGSFNQFLMN
jgi:hypothetical protein